MQDPSRLSQETSCNRLSLSKCLSYQAQKQKKLEEEILKEFDDAMRMQAALEEEEKVFKSYAEKCLSEWQDNVGRCSKFVI